MRNLTHVLVVVIFLSVGVDGRAQIGDSVSLDESCSYSGGDLPENVVTFASNEEAEEAIARIVDVSGLMATGFKVVAAGIDNAAATIEGTTRYILYNQTFMREILSSGGSDWKAMSILAHEVGHHLNGHTLDERGSRPTIELEADYFSGYVLQKLGASLRDAQAAMEEFGSEEGTLTHPPKHDRLAAVANGWSKACDQDASCREPIGPSPGRRNIPPSVVQGGPDSCEYAGDGYCDEPDLCDRGTDTTDCQVARRLRDRDPLNFPPMPAPQAAYPLPAQVCVTSGGTCTMMVQIPPGLFCTCYTAYGVVSGVAR